MSATTLRTVDGLRLQGRWWEAADPRGGAGIVLVHGFTGSASEPALVALAEALCDEGFPVLAYDARGHGPSDGLCTLGDLERHDVAAAVAEARERSGRVVVVGASMGAIAALRHAAEDPRLDGVVAVSSPARWRRPRTARTLLATGVTRTAVGRWLAARRMDVRISPTWSDPETPASLATRIEIPLALIHGSRDRFIPARDAHELARACSGSCRLEIVRGMGHAFHRLGIPAIRAAVAWTLSAARRRVPDYGPAG